MWSRTLSNERRLNSDYITNSFNLLNHGDVVIEGSLSISGIINSPITNLLSVSVNQNSNSINQLSISSATTNNKLELYETLNINNFNLLGTTTLQLDINQNNSNLLQGIQNNLLQNQINDLTILGVSENNWNGVFAVSSAIIDSKVGLTIGVSIPILDNRIINLTTTGLNNYNSLSSNISILNTFKMII